MSHPEPLVRPLTPTVRRSVIALLLGLMIAVAMPAFGATDSARFRFEGNKWLALDLSVGNVRAEVIRFEWPSTMLGVKTGYKASIKLVNGSTRQARTALALILYDRDGKPVGVGTTSTKLGTIDPGDSAEFSITFNHITARLEQADQFHLVIETR